MPQPNDLSRSLPALHQNSTIMAVVELSHSSWLVGGVLPGIERQPRKKLEPNPERLRALLHRWRDEAVRDGRTITRIAVAFEADGDGFWLARWLEARGVESHVIHPSSVAVSREHRRAKTDRLDTELLKRGFLGWLRGERGHCSMARVPTIAEEDAKRPNRERDCLVGERTRIVNRIDKGHPGPAARAGNARVPHGSSPWAEGPRGMIQLAWRFLMFQKESALAVWYRARTADSRSGTRKTMIVALARKLIIALWRFVTTGEPLEGVVLRPAS